MKILVIEDDAGLNRGSGFALSQEGYELLTAASAVGAVYAQASKRYIEIIMEEFQDRLLYCNPK